MPKAKILFVCLGNICRSPLAEAIFKYKIEARGWQKHFESDSCGTSNYHIGSPPDERTIENALKNGIRINHRGRQLTKKDLEGFDYIFAMDQHNYENIFRLTDAELHVEKVKLMRHFDPHEKEGEVPDPYFGGEQGFQEVFEILDRSIENFIIHLEEKFEV